MNSRKYGSAAADANGTWIAYNGSPRELSSDFLSGIQQQEFQ